MTRIDNQAGRRRYYSRYIAHYTKKNYPLIALGVLFIAGVLIGTLLLRTAGGETLELLLRMVDGFMGKRREQSMMQNFLSGAFSSTVFTAALFVCGFCAISQPVVVAVPLFRGLGVGFSMASMYAGYGFGTAGTIGVLMLPGTVLTTIAILICCHESLKLSCSFFSAMGGAGQSQEFYPLRVYFARFFACEALCVLSAFIEAILFFGFANSLVLG